MLRRTLTTGALVLLLVAAGCSHGKDTAAASKSTTTLSTTTTIKRPAHDDPSLAAYCGTWRSILALGTADLSGPVSGQAQIIRDHYGKVLLLAEKLEAQAPASIKPMVTMAVTITQEAIAKGSAQPMGTPENASNGQQLNAFSSSHCAAKSA